MSGSSSWGGRVDVTEVMVVIGECVDATGLETAVVEGLEVEVVLPSGKLLSGTSVSTLCCGSAGAQVSYSFDTHTKADLVPSSYTYFMIVHIANVRNSYH